MLEQLEVLMLEGKTWKAGETDKVLHREQKSRRISKND